MLLLHLFAHPCVTNKKCSVDDCSVHTWVTGTCCDRNMLIVTACSLQVFSVAGDAAAVEHASAQQSRRRQGNTNILTHHRLAVAGALQGQLLGMSARPVPLGTAATRVGRDSLYEPMYELTWQVADPPDAAIRSSYEAHGVPRTSVSLRAHSGSAVSSMLSILQAADVHGAAAVELRGTEQASALYQERGEQSMGAIAGGAWPAMLRAFDQESSAVVAVVAADASAAGGNSGTAGSSLVVSNEHTGGISNGYGSRLTAGMTLSAVLLPSAMRTTPGAAVAPLIHTCQGLAAYVFLPYVQ